MIVNSALVEIPVLKAWNRIFELVARVAENPYNRDGLRDSILDLFHNKTEKSVLRGMAIPTLRRLGLIIGFQRLIRLSANGKLVHEARKMTLALGTRALGTIVYEMDAEIGFLGMLEHEHEIPLKSFIEFWTPRVNAPNAVRARERIRDWLGLLGYCDLIIETRATLSLNREQIKFAAEDADYKKKNSLFKKLLFLSYKKLVQREKGKQSHPIEDLRAEMALTILSEHKQILTEKQFDELLARFPKTSPDYLVSFGRPMGADEKLFHYDGKYYQTIAIRSFEE